MVKIATEVCHITHVTTQHDRFLGFSVFKSHYAAHAGKNIVAKSDEYEIDSGDFSGGPKAKQEAQERADQQREVAYQQVLQQLVAAGWEPVGTDEDGRVC